MSSTSLVKLIVGGVMKIEFYDATTNEIEIFQEDFMVDSEGTVFEYCDHDIYGWGYYRNSNVYCRVVD